MDLALQHAESSDLSDTFKLRLRKLREVNLLTANEFCKKLKALYTEYMQENTQNDSKLGEHSKAYLNVMAEREDKQTMIPLAAHEWSQDLSLGARTVASDHQVSVLFRYFRIEYFLLIYYVRKYSSTKILPTHTCITNSPHISKRCLLWHRLCPRTQRRQ